MEQPAMPPSPQAPGPLLLLGSGETAPNIQKAYTWLFQQVGRTPVSVAVLETPAGFEPNSDAVAGQVARHIEAHLVNFAPQVDVVAARGRGTAFSPDDPAVVAPLWDADVLMAGPGSPSYAVRQLRGSLAWEILRARHRLGAGLVFSSAATLAISSTTLPVYEIYKVGEDLHWKQGLNLLADFGLPLVFVSHWNNHDGGDRLDTSRCYLGQARFERLLQMLPPSAGTVVGIDEKTALCIDFAQQRCLVLGAGGVTLLRDGTEQRIGRGHELPLAELGNVSLPVGGDRLAPAVWAEALARQAAPDAEAALAVPHEAERIVAARESARARRDWGRSDQLRDELAELGWRVTDTPAGPELAPISA